MRVSMGDQAKRESQEYTGHGASENAESKGRNIKEMHYLEVVIGKSVMGDTHNQNGCLNIAVQCKSREYSSPLLPPV